VIEDIKVKNVIVNVSGTRYSVPASMLVAAWHSYRVVR
jgi:hypothetical protein